MMWRCLFKPHPLIVIWILFLACGAGVECRAADAANSNAVPIASTNQFPTLTSAEQIHRLSRQEAATGRHVLIRGVVTCTLPQFGAVVVQDGRAGIYINNIYASSSDLPQVGELVEVEGKTDPGEFAPLVQASRIKRLGTGEMPAPVHPYWDQMINGSLDTE